MWYVLKETTLIKKNYGKGVKKMTKKRFTLEEINETTNKLFIKYIELFKNNQISFHEYTIIQNIIMMIQCAFEEKGDVE